MATAIFEKNRERIEAAASAKYDSKGVDATKYEGLPVVMVRADDL